MRNKLFMTNVEAEGKALTRGSAFEDLTRPPPPPPKDIPWRLHVTNPNPEGTESPISPTSSEMSEDTITPLPSLTRQRSVRFSAPITPRLLLPALSHRASTTLSQASTMTADSEMTTNPPRLVQVLGTVRVQRGSLRPAPVIERPQLVQRDGEGFSRDRLGPDSNSLLRVPVQAGDHKAQGHGHGRTRSYDFI
ncbi:hypothetical protein DL93DRAFT_2106106 [Clavulina sp. PMI_390]|nr:hypothetical protein DL93DRAFT_2106106 [Clavulina sp. PMI_390]